jgi:hypothetical protein
LLKISGLIKGIGNPAPKEGQKGEEQGENWSRTHRKKLIKQGNNGAGQRTEQTEGGGTQQKARKRTLETGTQRGGRLKKKPEKTSKEKATHRANTQTQIRKEKLALSSILHHKD